MPFDQPTPRPLRQVTINDFAPTASGVYGLSNAREWIYIGETDNIQGALMDHLRDSDEPAMRMHPTGFVFEVCDRARRPARQDRLVLEYEPACNRNNRHLPRYLR
jgi:hypothetical protein